MLQPLARRRLIGRLGLGLACAPVVAGCSGGELVSALTPRNGVERVPGIAYGPGERQRLDLYLPQDGASATIVFFYGGSWRDGAREEFAFVGYGLASLGYAVAIPDYRLAPEFLFPAFVEDGARAVDWIAGAEGRRAGAAGPLFVAGHSAGAHIAAMLALDPAFLGAYGHEPSLLLAGWIGLSGPYDFYPFHDAEVAEVFSAVEPADSQPIDQVAAGRPGPPALLATGLDDETVRPANTHHLARALREVGGEPVVETYEGLGHVDTVLALTPLFSGRAPILASIDRFVRTHSA